MSHFMALNMMYILTMKKALSDISVRQGFY